MLLRDITDTIPPAKIVLVLSLIYFFERYNWAINNADLDIIKKLELTDIKKY